VLVAPRLPHSICCQGMSSRLLRVDLRLRTRNARFFACTGQHQRIRKRLIDFFEFLFVQVELIARDTLVVIGDFNAVMCRSARAPIVTLRENANTDMLVDFVARHDLVSANTRFCNPGERLAAFDG
jgi:hypothetical protein